MVCTECGRVVRGKGRRRHPPRRRPRRRRRAPVVAAAVIAAAALAALFIAAQDGAVVGAGLPPELSADGLAGMAGRAAGAALEVLEGARTLAHTSLPTPAGPDIGMDGAVSLVHRLTNDERAAAGVPPLARDAALDGIAQMHADDMAERGYFSHDTPEGAGPSDRAAASGYACAKAAGAYTRTGIGENIHYAGGSYLYTEGVAAVAVGGWMDSPGHRANILDAGYDRLGVGIAIGGGQAYAVQNFC